MILSINRKQTNKKLFNKFNWMLQGQVICVFDKKSIITAEQFIIIIIRVLFCGLLSD